MPGKRELNREALDAAAEGANAVGGVSKQAKTMLLIPAIVVLAALLVGGAFCAYAATRDTVAPNTIVGGVDVGGLTEAEAAERIGAALDDLRKTSGVHALLESGEEAAFFSYEALDVRFDADALARDAYETSHTGNPIADAWTLLRAMLGSGSEVTPMPAEGWTVSAARKLAEAAAVAPQDFSCEMDESYHLYLTKERDGRRVDAAALRAILLDSGADETGARTVTLPCSAVPAKTGDLDAINEKYGGEMANARYDKETQTILPERMAVNFDVAEARRLLSAAEPGARIEVPTVVSEPEVTAEELAKVLFRDVLGSYTTRVGGAAGRKSNVQLTAKRVNGAVLNSGEDFNYYSYTGPFSASNGYQSAPGYLHGKTVEMDGGGACQCSSTIYAAALLANLEIVARTAHGFASDYIGLGLDATVSGGGPDFIFRNNTLYPIKIETVYSANNRLTVNLYGTKTDHITVKMRTEVLSTTPFEEQIVEDPALAPGERVVEQTAYTGYVVNTYRQLYEDGKFISESLEARSKYNKRDRIVHVGPAAAEASTSTPVEQTPVEQTPAGQTAPADPAPVQTPEQSVPQPTPSEIPGGISPTPIDEQINQLAQQLEGGGA